MELKKLLEILKCLEPILDNPQIFIDSDEDGIYGRIYIFEGTDEVGGTTIRISLQ